MNQIQKITSLVQELNEHRNAYYNLNAPTITDKEYDQLKCVSFPVATTVQPINGFSFTEGKVSVF